MKSDYDPWLDVYYAAKDVVEEWDYGKDVALARPIETLRKALQAYVGHSEEELEKVAPKA
jgi:hypothetical protein